MLESQYEFKIIKDHDVDTFKRDFDKVDTIKLDLKNNKLHKLKFEELFERLAATKISYFQLDLSNYELDNDKFEAVVACIRNWNLKTLVLIMSGTKLTDSQFESLIFESLRTMNNLENLYLDFENTNFTVGKRKAIEKLIPQLDNLNNVFINLKNTKLTKDDVALLSKSIQHISAREFLF